MKGDALGAIAKKIIKMSKKICLICFLCCALLVYSSGLFGSNKILEKIGNFSGCKNKRIKQKTNPTASKTKVFITLVHSLFRKQ